MNDSSPGPPPLPGRGESPPPLPPELTEPLGHASETALGPAEFGKQSRCLWAWPLIVAALVALMAAPYLHHEAEAVSDESNQLALLRFQALQLIGAARLQASAVVEQWPQLRNTAASPRAVAAIAVVERFLDLGELPREGTVAWLDEALGDLKDGQLDAESREASAEVLNRVRRFAESPEGLEAEDWEQLETDLGWFGELARAVPQGPDAAKAQRIRDMGVAVAGGFGLLVIGGIGAGLLGICLLIGALFLFRSGKLAFAFRAPGGASGPFLGAFALYLALMAVANLLSSELPMLFAIGMAALSFGIGLLWAPVTRQVGWKRWFYELGLHRGRGVLRELGAGLVGYVAMLPLVAIGLVASMVLIQIISALRPDEPLPSASHPIVGALESGGWPVMLILLFLASVVAPVTEEALFRGAFLGGLRKKLGALSAGLLSAFVFAAVHSQGVFGIPALMAIGFGFGLLREWRGSLIAPMLAHAVHNGMLVAGLWVLFSLT